MVDKVTIHVSHTFIRCSRVIKLRMTNSGEIAVAGKDYDVVQWLLCVVSGNHRCIAILCSMQGWLLEARLVTMPPRCMHVHHHLGWILGCRAWIRTVQL